MTTDIPTIDQPTNRPNLTRVVVLGRTYWFSYQTCIAVNLHDGRSVFVRENTYSATTAKHMAHIERENNNRPTNERLTAEQFAHLLTTGELTA